MNLCDECSTHLARWPPSCTSSLLHLSLALLALHRDSYLEIITRAVSRISRNVFFWKLIFFITRFNFRTWDSTASFSPTDISGEVKSQFSETSSPRHPSPVSTNGQIVCLTKRPLAFRLASSPSPLAASSLAELDAGARGERPGLPESLIISPIAFCHFPRRRFVLSCPLHWRRFSLS